MWVCLCEAVTSGSILEAIDAGARTVKEIGEANGAGTGCGRCAPNIRLLIEQQLDHSVSEKQGTAMESKARVVKLLNGLLTTELRAINQYFLDSKLASHWGLDRLADEYREASFEEMRDAEKLMDRILLLGGLPNLQRADPFAAGETVPEQLRLAAQLEEKAVGLLHAGISGAESAADPATALMLREMLLGEEAQLDWIEAQLGLIDRVGEANYLSQKINK